MRVFAILSDHVLKKDIHVYVWVCFTLMRFRSYAAVT